MMLSDVKVSRRKFLKGAAALGAIIPFAPLISKGIAKVKPGIPAPPPKPKTIKFRKYSSLELRTDPLVEGVTPYGRALKVTYGDISPRSAAWAARRMLTEAEPRLMMKRFGQ